ncbi:amino acid kinase family protein [Kitasatospora sp. NBC_01266]|uniref:amino acid kinase family protein n=1 Tax=Kitasatospora sp. NBC_01266 TaxID=2903572 RepID=UPI002E3138D0|nr:hypothetical protein [Kitasatospora sp. NBC_01266]
MVIDTGEPELRTRSTAAQVSALVEALPALARLHGRCLVVALGGRAAVDAPLQQAFAQDVALLRYLGVRVVVVHGGDPQVAAHLDRLGGARPPAGELTGVVRMVLTGQVQRELVRSINAYGPFAVGLTGEDAHTMTAVERPAPASPAPASETPASPAGLGLAGDIVDVDPGILRTMLDDGRVPVVSALARGADGAVYTVATQAAAGALAAALPADLLVLMAGPGRPGAVGERTRPITGDVPHALLTHLLADGEN